MTNEIREFLVIVQIMSTGLSGFNKLTSVNLTDIDNKFRHNIVKVAVLPPPPLHPQPPHPGSHPPPSPRHILVVWEI